jgi:hypothetical protein
LTIATENVHAESFRRYDGVITARLNAFQPWEQNIRSVTSKNALVIRCLLLLPLVLRTLLFCSAANSRFAFSPGRQMHGATHSPSFGLRRPSLFTDTVFGRKLVSSRVTVIGRRADWAFAADRKSFLGYAEQWHRNIILLFFPGPDIRRLAAGPEMRYAGRHWQ